MDEKVMEDFRVKLVRMKMTIKDFAIEHDFNVMIFYQALNGSTNMRDTYVTAIKEFVGNEKDSISD